MHCDHHPACPGCPLLDLPYPAQLQAKRARLVDAVRAYAHLDLPPVPQVRPAPRTEGYRHRLKLPVDVQGQAVAIGLYDGATHNVLDTPTCPVLAPALREGLEHVRTWLRGTRGVHSVDLRRTEATGELQLVLAVDGGELHGGKKAARALLDAVPGLTSLAVSTADPAGKRVMGRAPRVVAGKLHVEEAIGATRYRLHPGAFFQVDPAGAEPLHGLVRELVGDAQTVLDLYAGVGAYALALAPGRRRVVAVEEVTQAARAAREVAPPNVEVVASKVEHLEMTEPFDVVILNPARRGSDPKTLAALGRLAQRAIYVSCGPETLARDLDVLAAHGLRVDRWEAVDLFPQTGEVETIVHLVRGPPVHTWPIRGGRACGPWLGQASGVLGRATEALAMVVGDPGPAGRLHGATFDTLGIVATHAVIRLNLEAPVDIPLQALARRGHPTVGLDPRTARFFAEKAGLQRPFVHYSRAEGAHAPLHGDLVQALLHLGADADWVERVRMGTATPDHPGGRRAPRRPRSNRRR